MMKFFKYLIFISLSLFSVSALAANYKWDNGILSATGTESTICQNIANALGSKTFRPWKQSQGADFIKCTLERDNGGGTWSSMWEGNANLTADECSPQSIKSKPITVSRLDKLDFGSTPMLIQQKSRDKLLVIMGVNIKTQLSLVNRTINLRLVSLIQLRIHPVLQLLIYQIRHILITLHRLADGCKSGEAYCDKPTTGCPSWVH